eukprot:5872013-Pyramimonas_sp.AAC.1
MENAGLPTRAEFCTVHNRIVAMLAWKLKPSAVADRISGDPRDGRVAGHACVSAKRNLYCPQWESIHDGPETKIHRKPCGIDFEVDMVV